MTGEPAIRNEDKQKNVAKSMAGWISGLVIQTSGADRIVGTDYGQQNGENKTVKGVRVVIKDTSVRVNVHIAVVFGKTIPEIARQIQKETSRLFDQVFPDYQLKSINVYVDSIVFNQDSVLYRKQAIESLNEAGWRQKRSGGNNRHETAGSPGTGDESPLCQ